MQNLYRSFLGIDIGKHEFVSHLKNDDKTKTYKSNRNGFKKFVGEHSDSLSHGLIVLETTGGYEKRLIDYLLINNLAVHRADTRKERISFVLLGNRPKLTSSMPKLWLNMGMNGKPCYHSLKGQMKAKKNLNSWFHDNRI